eukprot:CAMPEP_0118724196 /NCGR_PEP_ID=MMETSP0800-20121206/32429_1 /TAXON_ID=210618 ORGANISM="Striatella unipunctata, Strain CCMP2910" /NCGR_SAMPLE_ID=MMETSP0800 /ASSEMBLY_ACC=CAM_ASM_000638 /LENGTH=215 /DNA_ID=CAMNT_0006632715 /DNA_START=313 /DNA_END=960 /DNA_ORIENTATION=-
MEVIDPWGSRFVLVVGDTSEKDARGLQDGGVSEGLAMRDLTIYVPCGANIAGIARFYDKVLASPVLQCSNDLCQISVGPKQTLTFQSHPEGKVSVSHADIRDDGVVPPEGKPAFLSNYGPHVSMYTADFKATYERVDSLGLAYVNPRFKRRAYSMEEALDQCMFRCFDIVDPDDIEAGPIIKLEHEIRSCVKPNGSKYKSCPFDAIPEAVVLPSA